MGVLRYRIADLIVEMEPRFDLLIKRALPYLYEGDEVPKIKLSVGDSRLLALHGINPKLSPGECEYMLAGADFYNALLEHDGLLLHASAVVLNDEAYMFSAPSGTGKSTHTQQWLKAFENAEILNDDKPAIRCLDGRIYAYGTPFSGKHDISRNIRTDLKGIAFVERANENSIERITDNGESLRRILEQTIRPNDAARMSLLLGYLDALITKVPIYILRCNISTEAAKTAYEEMKKHEA